MEHNVMAHYVLDADGSVVPLIHATTASTVVPLTSALFARHNHQSILPQVQQQQQQSGQNQLEAHVTIINFEQCCVCSVMYEQRRPGPVLQPDLNRMISRALDVCPETQFFREYLPFCANCTSLLRKFDRLRVELEFVKTQLVTYVVESLTQIRAEGESQLDGLKSQILNRWTDTASGEEKNHKKGFSAASTSNNSKAGDLSWAAYNNLTNDRSTAVVEPIENWNVVSEVTIEAVADNVQHDSEIEMKLLHSDNNEDDGVNDPLSPNNDQPAVAVILGGDAGLANHKREVATDVSLKSKHLKRLKGVEKNSGSTGKRRLKEKAVRKSQAIDQEVTPLICVKCGRIHGPVKTYNAHAQVCSFDDLKMEKICSICTEGGTAACLFETWNDFRDHVLHQHPVVKLEVCRFCKLRFLPFGVKHHKCIQKYKGQVDKEAVFKCDQCGRAYNFRANLTDHVRRSHKDQKHACSICGKTYGSPMLLKFHMERHTSVVTKFKCNVCGVCLSSNYSLKEHMKRHTGEQPYNCNVCDKKFSSRTIFNSHQMVHTDLKPHVCEVCGKGFKLRGTMRRHLSRHLLNETKYTKKCPLCPKAAFRKVWILKRHMKEAHPETAELEEVLEKYKDIDDTPSTVRPSIVGPGTERILTAESKSGNKSEAVAGFKKDGKRQGKRCITEQTENSKTSNPDMGNERPSSPVGAPSSRQSARLVKKSEVVKGVGIEVSGVNPQVSASKSQEGRKRR